jgi:hypothetical protein
MKTMTDYEERERWVVVRDTTGGGTEYIIGFEGSQALPVTMKNGVFWV